MVSFKSREATNILLISYFATASASLHCFFSCHNFLFFRLSWSNSTIFTFSVSTHKRFFCFVLLKKTTGHHQSICACILPPHRIQSSCVFFKDEIVYCCCCCCYPPLFVWSTKSTNIVIRPDKHQHLHIDTR